MPSIFLVFYIVYSSSRLFRFTSCGVGGTLLLCGLIVLTSIDQDEARHSFGHSGGMCITDSFIVMHLINSILFDWKINLCPTIDQLCPRRVKKCLVYV